jgi:tripartite-type tricarboxylate transporter receptor subunit TctC
MVHPDLSRRLCLATAGALAFVAALPAAAQGTFPERPITLVVPNAPGGAADSLARGIAEEWGKRLKQTVVVENASGASGAIAAQKVARATPDGYTLLFATTTELIVTPIANKAAGYSLAQFAPIAKVGVTPMVLVARPGLGVQNIDQLVALARQKPNGLSVGTTGTASLQAFATVALQRAAGVDLLGVPYKGGAQIVTDLLGGQLDLGVMTLPGALTHVRSGKLVMLGLLSEKRAPSAPEMPTVNESRTVRGVEVQIWAGVAGPASLPAAVLERLNRSLQEVVTDRDFTERRARMGDMAVPPESAAEFARFLATEDERYRALATGLKLE